MSSLQSDPQNGSPDRRFNSVMGKDFHQAYPSAFLVNSVCILLIGSIFVQSQRGPLSGFDSTMNRDPFSIFKQSLF